MKPNQDLLWKINRDSYYAALYQEFGYDFIVRAGFLVDNALQDVDVKATTNILCTHVPDLTGIENPVVLLTTGAFCPFHEGHLTMNIHAKQAVEATGKTVIAAYISPSHDEYVLAKIPNSYNIHERISKIEKFIQNYPWLFIESWEAVFCKVAINFTDVIDRLEAYIETHTGRHIPVYYVCGGDNARFALTFTHKGHCVVVSRPSYDISDLRQELAGNDRIIWAEGNSRESSTNIRSKGLDVFEKRDAYIRRENVHPFETKLVELMRPHFKDLEVVNYVEQVEAFKIFPGPNRTTTDGAPQVPIVSLDALIQGDISLRVSRLFNLFGTRKLGYIHREPTQKNSGAEIAHECYLFDDDIYSGGTIKYATSVLKARGIKVKGVFTFKMSAEMEILDCRDFLLGHPEGGLVIQLPNGKITRVPYIYPFICPHMRASIQDAKRFSIEVWQLNLEYFHLNPTLVQDVPSICEALYSSGFKPTDAMATVCEYYITFLQNC